MTSSWPGARSACQRPRPRGPPVARCSEDSACGPAGDRSEVEADQVAAAVVRALRDQRPDPAGPADVSDDVGVRPMAGRIRRNTTAGIIGEAGGAVDADTDAAIHRAAGTGRPLDDRVRRRMERGFGADLSAVRVHANPAADDLSRRIQAQAFTTGNDIFFAKDHYDPSSRRGEHLLAHELTHVVQQGAGSGVRRSTVIRRVPAAFAGERTRLEQNRAPSRTPSRASSVWTRGARWSMPPTSTRS